MANITISIDDRLLKEAKKIAIDQDTSFSGLVREFVADLVTRKERERSLLIDELDDLLSESSARVGTITWSRDDLHER